jgi:DNA-binding NarL/FixJ family response regulator
VLLAEDAALVRAGFRALLAKMPDVTVVAEAADGREALKLARAHHPDVVLMDLRMPGMSGLEATQRIVRELPEARVVIVSMHDNEEYVWQAMRSGAAGYVLKDSSPSDLRYALQTVMKGQTYLSPSLAARLEAYVRRVGDLSPLERLTPRQREILQLIAEGHTNREMAKVLGISIKTVDTHRRLLMETLDLHDVAALVRFAVRVGLIPPG